MKKIKKIILSIIVSLIALISVFSCFKGKYTPEPILSPVSVLRPANSVNDNAINPTGTYDYIYFNTSLSSDDIMDIAFNISKNQVLDNYIIYADMESAVFLVLEYQIGGNELFPDIRGSVYLNLVRLLTISNGVPEFENIYNFIGSGAEVLFNQDLINPYEYNLSGGVSEIDLSVFGLSGVVPVGQQNNLLTNLISPVPFLFEGTTTNTQTSTGFPENEVESVYINTNYTNVALKDIIDTKIGYNDVSFTLTSDTQNYTIRINNTTYECYIYLNNDYIYIYDYTNTTPDVYWWGYSPIALDNSPLLYNVDLYTISGWNQNYSFLFSEVNNFGLVDPTYEEGYLDGKNDVINNPNSYGLYTSEQYDNRYNYGYENGYTSGVNNVTSNPREYNLYTYQEYNENYADGYDNGYDEGYLAGLDDGAGTNINFQYVESVLNLVGNFLNIEVLPGVKLSYALGVIIILTIISIIKMVVK